MAEIIEERATKISDWTEPVKGFPLKFRWHTTYWPEIFDLQIELIRDDIRRARAGRKLIMYLSCPISARGGGDHNTNVDIAKAVERHLISLWGERLWILNPASYQLESKEGTGLIERHAQRLDYDLRRLTSFSRPEGGDYMRMWTKILVEDALFFGDGLPKELLNSGQHFDGYYFVGPGDVAKFFSSSGGKAILDGIESYFAEMYALDADFRDRYTVSGINWGELPVDGVPSGSSDEQAQLRNTWTKRRMDYLRYYSLRASVNYSLGSHDEWEIYREINVRRRLAGANRIGIADQLAGFFDGMQLAPGASESQLSHGYAD